MSLPAEILLKIFQFLEFHDIISCCRVDCLWNQVAQDDHIWKRLFLQRWKHHVLSRDFIVSWKSEYIKRFGMDRRVYGLLKASCSPDQRKQALLELKDMGKKVWEELNRFECMEDPRSDMSISYFARHAKEQIHKKVMLLRWDELMRKSPKEIRLEDGAILIANFEYKELDTDSIYRKLDELAANLKEKITPDMSTLDILNTLSHFLFQELDFDGNLHQYYDPKNSYLNDVLERRRGIPISLSILYAAIAQRVGIKLDPIGFPTHFLLGVQLDRKRVFIDPFNRGEILETSDCQELLERNAPFLPFSESFLNPITPEEVFSRVMLNLLSIYRDRLQTHKLLGILQQKFRMKPIAEDLNLILRILASDKRWDEALEELEIARSNPLFTASMMMENVIKRIHELESTGYVVKSRSDPKYRAFKFSIGDVVYNSAEKQRGVVIGYFFDKDRGDRCYSVLMETQEASLILEANLEPAINKEPILHPELGRYFCQFNGTIYIANEELRAEYPNN